MTVIFQGWWGERGEGREGKKNKYKCLTFCMMDCDGIYFLAVVCENIY